MIEIREITMQDPYYQDERTLRNMILLRPIGVADHAWEMHDDISWHFIALNKNEVIGCVVLKPLDLEKKHVQLMQMAVDTTFQKRGIGRMLVEKIQSFVAKNKIKDIVCHSRDYAVPFYQKMGFVIYGDPFVEVGIEHRHMRYITNQQTLVYNT